MTGCDATLAPSDEKGSPPGPTVDGDDDGILGSGIDGDENTDTVDSDDDRDRDGVTDDRDVCPDTAPRTDVDEMGCAIPGAECGNGIVDASNGR